MNLKLMKKMIQQFMSKEFNERSKYIFILNSFLDNQFKELEKEIGKPKLEGLTPINLYVQAKELFEENKYFECLTVLKPLIENCYSSAIYLAYKIYDEYYRHHEDEYEKVKEEIDFDLIEDMYFYLYKTYRESTFHVPFYLTDLVEHKAFLDEDEKEEYVYTILLNYYARCNGYDMQLYQIADDLCQDLMRFNKGLVWMYFAAIKGNIYAKYSLALAYEAIEHYEGAFYWCNKIVGKTDLEANKENYYLIKKLAEENEDINKALLRRKSNA
ncbi:MAG: hypothetical protein NC310_01155 [Roseburia sp.]|nr:hypothetical protein [Anaeroplasma bactoclasticum]MCM1195661.1 hypothetical protein [Roseburia sp.]MCM1556118.1 hypothetical protein [Anaeroplasma bactoclasticum]